MSAEKDARFTLFLNAEQMEFLRQLLDSPGINVPIRLARVAGEVHALVNTIAGGSPDAS